MMRIGELWRQIDRHVAALPARPDGRRPTLTAVLKSSLPADILAGVNSLTEAFKTQRATERNPSLAQLEAFVKSNAHLTLVEFRDGRHPGQPTDVVAGYTARIQRVFNGNGRGFFEIMKELDADERVKVQDMRAIVAAVLGGSTSRLSRKAAKEAIVSEFATLEVSRVSTDAASRSRPY